MIHCYEFYASLCTDVPPPSDVCTQANFTLPRLFRNPAISNFFFHFPWDFEIAGFKYCLQFLLGVKMAPRKTENNAYAKFWGDKQRALWYVMVFSGVVNFTSGIL